MNKELICAAFCDQVVVTKVPVGFAVKTPFLAGDGEAIGFYIVGSQADSEMFRLEDAGTAIPFLEAAGVNLKTGTRSEALERMLNECGAELDTSSLELHTEFMREDQIATAALQFVSLLIRLQDLELLTPESVENTFKAAMRYK